MRISRSDESRFVATVLRFTTTRFGLHRTCRIRKCRRDGGCTGPMLRDDPDIAHFVAARPDDPAHAIAPLCCWALDRQGRERVAGTVDRVLDRLEEKPWAPFPEETRAIAARDWTGHAIPQAAEPLEEKPLSSPPLCAKGAPE